ncbi:MAG: MarR family winged helix-turn-helix transcriptional regulator [Alphaproteobacteria bacterium]
MDSERRPRRTRGDDGEGAAAEPAGPSGALRLDAFLPYRLSIASTTVSRRIAAVYAARHGLTIPEWRLIAVLAEDGSATQQGLVRRTLMDKVAVSRAAQALEARGLIARAGDDADGRAMRARLTRAGRALHAAIAPDALAEERHLLAGFTVEEVRQLHAMLRRLERAAGAAR